MAKLRVPGPKEQRLKSRGLASRGFIPFQRASGLEAPGRWKECPPSAGQEKVRSGGGAGGYGSRGQCGGENEYLLLSLSPAISFPTDGSLLTSPILNAY